MKRREAAAQIEKMLSGGAARPAVYRELSARTDIAKNDLLAAFATVADPEVRRRFHTRNLVLLGLIAITLVLQVVLALLFIMKLEPGQFRGAAVVVLVVCVMIPYVLIWSMMGIWRFRGHAYGVFGLISLSIFIALGRMFMDLTAWLVFNGTWFAAIVLALHISKNAFPYYRFFITLDRERLERDLTGEKKG